MENKKQEVRSYLETVLEGGIVFKDFTQGKKSRVVERNIAYSDTYIPNYRKDEGRGPNE